MIGILTGLMLCAFSAATDYPDVAQLPVLDRLPDPMTMASGERVQTSEEWKARRAEILNMLLHYEYGHLPPAPDNLQSQVISTEPVFDGKANLVRLALTMGPGNQVKMEAGLYVPTSAGKKSVLLAVEPVWHKGLLSAAELAVNRGYIFAGYQRQDLDPDDKDRSNGVHPLYPDYDWATLAVWAWGACRMVDYLNTRDDVDTAHIALMGHSRAGKTALLAAALDERIALVAPHGSGSGGAGSFRFCPKRAESLAMITNPKRFQYWFQPRLDEFAGKEDRLPFDQHFMRALVAPRAVVSMDGVGDIWANPLGTQIMYMAAQPVFDFLGAPGKNVLHFRPGGHDTTDEDWAVILDYCDHFFCAKPRPSDVHSIGVWGGTEMPIVGEGLVLSGTNPVGLCFDQIKDGSIVVRSAYDPAKPGVVLYELGKDYTVDGANGTIARTATSRIPDFATNVLYGQKEFDHSKFPGFGNTPHTVYVDYTTLNGLPLFAPTQQADALKQSRERLEKGGPFKVIAFGDSITCGGDASEPRLQFTQRYAQWLQQQFPKATVEFENGATGGDSTVQGLARLEEKVLTKKPDLVLIGFGMNDHNKGALEPAAFENNLVTIVETIRARTGAESLVFSAFPPNPDWKYNSHRMEQFAAATRRATEKAHCAFADVFAAWQKTLIRKNCSSMLANNINHPNDFGHWLYFEVLKSVGF